MRELITSKSIGANVVQRSFSEFVLESALARAEETLPDRRVFGFSGSGAYLSAADLNDASALDRKTTTRLRG